MDLTVKCSVCQKEYSLREMGKLCPEPELTFIRRCGNCRKETAHTYVLTRKLKSLLRQKQEEEELKRSIQGLCREKGFRCRFIYQSVIITTPLCDWCFDYHARMKTLWHESTTKINFATNQYAKAHCQFRDRKMSVAEVIEYIADHDAWAAKTRGMTERR